MGIYDDMLDLEHPTSKRHPRMSEMDRAAQFAPFAALTGYDRIIVETGRLTDSRKDLDETMLQSLNRTINELVEREKDKPRVQILHFAEDDRKEGGEYIKTEGNIRKVDVALRYIVMSDMTRIRFDDIYDIKL